MSAAGEDRTSAPHDRRKRSRLELLGDLHGEITVFQGMVIRKISEAGAQIETSFPLHLQSLHDVRLSLGSHSVIVKARVAHCQLTEVESELVSYSCGLEFIDSPERVREAIRAFIERVETERGGGGAAGPT